MSVFISYSTKDSDFVTKLSTELVRNRIKVWLDKWEMQPGDSLIDKIQVGLQDASFLLVVLSKNSADSPWCKKEQNAGIMRELNERKVVVIPIIMEDCEVPLLLQEKVYANFKTNFDQGFSELLRPLSKLFTEHMGLQKKNDIITDYALNWGINKGFFYLDIDLINWYEKEKKSVLLQLKITGCKNATERFILQSSTGRDWLMKEAIISMMYVSPDFRDLNIYICKDQIYTYHITAKDKKMDITFEVDLRAVLMGVDTGNDILINLVDFLEMLDSGRSERLND